uniref:Unconventional prefoldin RPB5 interactor n=1 Tax=Schistosoma mansoni TaxID=6183 RepID=A0A3Q0KPG6_SCHMA
MAINEENFGRLLSRQTSDIETTEQEIISLEKYRSDYESVSNKIQELQKSVYKDAYIPFSRKALVRGRLIHTNELLVYLGGTNDYFAELSVYDTVQLLNRRIKRLDIKLDGLRQQKTLLNDRISYTKQLVSQKLISIPKDSSTCTRDRIVGGIEDDKEIEIREEYDSDAEIEWRKKHVNSRKQERLSNASRRSPVLSTRRVSFDLVEQVLGEHHTDCENISNSESDLDDKNLSTIHFQHSDTPSPIPREKVVDVSTLTIAEAVNFALKICNTHDKKKVFPVEPLGDIMERQPNVLAKAVNLTSEMSSTNHQSEILPTKPFGDINERQQNALDKSDISPPIITNERKRCSLFRSSRIRDSKPS